MYTIYSIDGYDSRPKHLFFGAFLAGRIGSGLTGPTRDIGKTSYPTRPDPTRPDPTRPDPTRRANFWNTC